MKMLRYLSALISLLIGFGSVQAAEILEARCHRPYHEAMQLLQDNIKLRGYAISRVQRIDRGMQKAGYGMKKYRLVFFGDPDELALIRHEYPGLLPFLPLNVTLIEEGDDEALVVAANPRALWGLFYEHPDLAGLFERWEEDVVSVMQAMEQCKPFNVDQAPT